MCNNTNEMTATVRRDEQGRPLATMTSDVLTVHVGRSTIDGVPYVMIDADNAGPMRVNLNDGNIWDGDPEQDVPALLDGFDLTVTFAGAIILGCLECNKRVSGPTRGDTLRAFVSDAKLHECEVER